MKKISNSSYVESAATLPAEAAVALVGLYKKFISPLFPPSCRFYPSCSTYSMDAFHIHGFFKGMILSIWRVIRCNPLSAGGYDPVRETHPFRRSKGI